MTQYMQSEDNSETKSSVSIGSTQKVEEKRSDGFSLQIANNSDMFKKNSNTNGDSYQRTRNSLVSAGINVVENSSIARTVSKGQSDGGGTPATKSKADSS